MEVRRTRATNQRSINGSAESQPTYERVPPQELEAEKALLGSVFVAPECLDEVSPLVDAGSFYSTAHQILYDVLLKMYDDGKFIDPVSVTSRLKKLGHYEEIGGAVYLAEILTAVPTAAHAAHYAELVREASLRRDLIRAATDIVRDGYDRTLPVDDLVNKAEQSMFAIRDGKGHAESHSIADLLIQTMNNIDARKRGDSRSTGIKTGFTDVDKILSGMRAGEVLILAARPGMGKTAWALNVAENVSMNVDVDGFAATGKIVIVSLEMSRYALMERLLCSRSKISSERIRAGTYSQEEAARLVATSSDLSRVDRIVVDDSSNPTVGNMAALCRRVKRKSGLAMLIIDYLQLVQPDDRTEPRQEQVAGISRRLKWLAKELEIPVLCLAQLNRQTEEKGHHRPKLSHLRESGAIEQDADVVMFVHRDEYYETDAKARAEVAGQAELIVAKNRNGPVATAKLVWMEQFTRFENRALEWQGGDDYQ